MTTLAPSLGHVFAMETEVSSVPMGANSHDRSTYLFVNLLSYLLCFLQELKNTEMGQRTEDMSAVLQDENVAPTE